MLEKTENRRRLYPAGFTLIELLLVIVIMGVLLSVILPRALRAGNEAKFSHVRQYASEISSYVTQWAQGQTEAQQQNSTYSVPDFLTFEVDPAIAGFESKPLVNHYTGDPVYDRVESRIPGDNRQLNPFNEVSYFEPVNNDSATPSLKPGLIYLVHTTDRVENRTDELFYLIFTGMDGNWYGQLDNTDPSGVRRGIFVGRYSASLTVERP